MKNKKHIFIPLFVFIGAFIVGLVWSIIDFTVVNSSKSYSYDTIQFNYDGASDGKDPDGNQFNPVNFFTDEIITEGLNRSNMASTYKVEDVRKNFVMENVVPKDIVTEITSYTKIVGNTSSTSEITTNDYRPVRYKVTLFQDLDRKLSKDGLNGLLTNMVNAYRDSFYATYQKSFNTTSYDEIYNLDNYDYVYQTEVYATKLRILSDSASSLYKEHNDFIAENNKSFNDIVLKSNQIISNDVNRINSTIALKALSKDINRLKDYYTYKIQLLEYDKTKNIADLNAITDQIANYTKDSDIFIPSGDSVIKVNGNSSATYDSLLKQQIAISDRISAINIEISDYQSILNDIETGASTPEDYAYVEYSIAKLGKDYLALETEYKGMIDQYNTKYITNGSITDVGTRYQSTSIASSAFVVRFAKISGPILLITVFGIAVFYVVWEVRKQKKVVAA